MLGWVYNRHRRGAPSNSKLGKLMDLVSSGPAWSGGYVPVPDPVLPHA